MQFAMNGSNESVEAGPEAPKVAKCPECGHVVTLRGRERGSGATATRRGSIATSKDPRRAVRCAVARQGGDPPSAHGGIGSARSSDLHRF